ncbi:hypothetical protein C0J52_02601 [Blattella germanica]|nr:hypothetical protein C0J52_02601 [Blattella germanica]
MTSVALHTLAWLLQMSLLCNSLPIVDPGLFVIMGVRSCRSGAGYCLLGLDCTLDEDFLPDDEGGHCDGLRSAFTPSAHFICCRYNAVNKTIPMGHDVPDDDFAHLGEDPPIQQTSFSSLDTSTYPDATAIPDLTSTTTDHISTSSEDMIFRRDDLAETDTSTILPLESETPTTETFVHETTTQTDETTTEMDETTTETEETSEPVEKSTDSSLQNRPIQPRLDLDEPTMTIFNNNNGIMSTFPSKVNVELELKVNDKKNSSVLRSVDGEITTTGDLTMGTTHYRTEVSVSAVTKSVSRRDTFTNLFDIEDEASTESTDFGQVTEGTTEGNLDVLEESTTNILHTDVERQEDDITMTTDSDIDKVTESNNPIAKSSDQEKPKEDFDNNLIPTTTAKTKSTSEKSIVTADNDMDNNIVLKNIDSDNIKHSMGTESSVISSTSPKVSEKIPETNIKQNTSKTTSDLSTTAIFSETTVTEKTSINNSEPTLKMLSETLPTEKTTPSNSGTTLKIDMPTEGSGVTSASNTISEDSETVKIKSEDTESSTNEVTTNIINIIETTTLLPTVSARSSSSESSTLDEEMFTTIRNSIVEEDSSTVTTAESDETLEGVETSDSGPQSRFGDSDLADSKTQTPEIKITGNEIHTELTVHPSESDVSKNTIPPGTTLGPTSSSTTYPSFSTPKSASVTTQGVTKNPLSSLTTENSGNITPQVPKSSQVPSVNVTTEDSDNTTSLNSTQGSVGNNSETRCGEFTDEGKDCWLVRFMDPTGSSSPMCVGSYVDARTIVTTANCVSRHCSSAVAQQDASNRMCPGFDNEIGSPMVCRGGILAGVTSSRDPEPVYTPIGDYLSWIRTNQKLEEHFGDAWK